MRSLEVDKAVANAVGKEGRFAKRLKKKDIKGRKSTKVVERRKSIGKLLI